MVTRQLYLNRLKKYQDTEFIKVITGVRRSGKTFILQMFRDYLKNNGIEEKQIIFINFESMKYQHLLNKDALYQFVIDHVLPDKKMYLFLMKYNECLNGKMLLIVLELIWMSIFIFLVPMHHYYLENLVHC
nr:AAA family ATPase [Paucilactobacillus hokkaidonensis]